MGGATAVNRVCELAVVVALTALLLLAARAVPATPHEPAKQPSRAVVAGGP
jgi:hypothetical protein